jgi:hypothetical protein
MKEGCNKELTISFISDEKMRPHVDYKWVVHVEKEADGTLTTCRQTLEECVEVAKEFLGQ